ncbi:aminodeoxychorismate synthase component I [Brevibacillus dissolubilis]|uniref:aminodeoxychorismate synthase component I n=1 Tax=Brevibacillus dissolubilis TaxID=1844116 RepID=UPI001115F4F8|nr:aminodeoxychorismate synthase component I [Brevibacillus dissolubilis]
MLLFEFHDPNDKQQPYLFREPLEIITAMTVGEVRPALRRVQEAVGRGFYAAGYLAYEAAPAFDPAYQVVTSEGRPLLWFGIYRQPERGWPTDSPEIVQEDAPAHMAQKGTGYTISDWRPDISVGQYQSGIAAIKEAIARGDTYQVNYTLRMRARFSGDDLAFYKRLSGLQRGSYAAYLDTGRYRILSASPELFFRWDRENMTITTKPMKGTAKRGRWVQEDLARRDELAASEKNQAENLMIVDLLRNDLGRIAEIGSVQVDKLFEIERYPTVYQMTSTITARTRPEVTLEDVFAALFPCGSITGAPKISTMEVISELEQTPRHVYCGTIGYLTPAGQAVFNIPIRTVLIDTETGEAEYGAGGGVTWDSTSEDEYAEILTKAALLTAEHEPFDLLETIRLEDGAYTLLEHHLERLAQSADYFGISFDRQAVLDALAEHAGQVPRGLYRVRLLLTQSGEIQVESYPFQPMPDTVQKVALATEPINSNSRFLYHKTTNRSLYEKARGSRTDIMDVLLINEKGELTEFTIGNLVVELDGVNYTPPIESGLLPGTFRAELLAQDQIHERKLTVKDLEQASRIWLINSLREWVPVSVEV